VLLVALTGCRNLIRNWSRQLLQIVIFVLVLGVVPAPSFSQSGPVQSAEEHSDPDRLAAEISRYDSWSEAQQAKAVGNVIGQMAAMFRRYPDRVDGWLGRISTNRIKAFAVIALGLSGDAARGVSFAKEGNVDTDLLIATLAYTSGDRFPSLTTPRPRTVADLLKQEGTLETTAQRVSWHQDILWSAAIVFHDGKIATRILERMDVLFAELKIEPGPVPMMTYLQASGDAKNIYNTVKSEYGEQAAWDVLYSFLYIASGGWSFSSNNRYPYVAAAFAEYDHEHPGSAAVKEVRLFK
jgi:hypothetical protein